MNTARRQLLKLLCLLPWTGLQARQRQSPLQPHLRPGYVLVDGWILKKSELPDHDA